MRFFDRIYEIGKLQQIQEISLRNAQFTIITGRRRIGKTSLVFKAYEKQTFLYFFVSRKAESELCDDFQRELESKLNVVSFGRAKSFSVLFEKILQLSKTQPITLFIDEFQDFLRVNKSIFSDMQKLWDINKQEAKINLIVCGSVNRLMNKIFKNRKEPLFGRQTDEIKVAPFSPSVLKEIMHEYSPTYTNEDLLALYAFTGGVAKYVEYFVDRKALTLHDMLSVICCRDSMYISEGKITLIEEFGKDYSMYFSILTAIASSHNQRNEIEDFVSKEVGGYLTKLEDDYGLIKKHQPLFERSSSSNVKYILNDNFYIFWFRFIYKYNYMIEIAAFDKLKAVIERDYETFSGKALERYFIDKLIESGEYTRIGGWWNRKGDEDIDIIAEDELSKTVEFYEVKRQSRRYDAPLLESRKDVFLAATHQFRKYSIRCCGLCMEDM